MKQEFSEILADVKEQILYLQELGVENLNADLPVLDDSKFKIENSKLQPVSSEPEITREKLERFVPTEEILKKTLEPPKASSIEQNQARRNLLETTKLS